jgi:hypothetical protein
MHFALERSAPPEDLLDVVVRPPTFGNDFRRYVGVPPASYAA